MLIPNVALLDRWGFESYISSGIHLYSDYVILFISALLHELLTGYS
jgi:hypothetical protein